MVSLVFKMQEEFTLLVTVQWRNANCAIIVLSCHLNNSGKESEINGQRGKSTVIKKNINAKQVSYLCGFTYKTVLSEDLFTFWWLI